MQVFRPGQDFVIHESEKNLNYRKQKLLLQRFLYERADAAASGRSRKLDIARSLGISRQALHKWEQEMNKGDR